MNRATIDHLVVAASTLEQGAVWCEATLGVQPLPGGRHPLMGTHNRLLRLSAPEHPACYLEIIAIDPEAALPARRRWFGLDGLDLSRGPRLVQLVARSDDLTAHRRSLVELGLDPGEAIAAHRDTPAGRLSWRILVRDDGEAACAGALPTLIEWQGPHPTDAMPDQGVALQSLRLAGLPRKVQAALGLRNCLLETDPPFALYAMLRTPRGVVALHT